MEEFDREYLLIGDKLNLIQSKCVAIVGLGGVGGYAAETLVRAGISKIIIIDNDKIDITNINRQIISLHSNIGGYKVDEFYKRLKDINPKVNIVKLNLFLDENNIEELFKGNPDYVIDACDTINTKKLIIRECIKRKIKFISSMGTGKKLDPTKLKIVDVRKTSYDPLAKIIRKMVKDEKIKEKVMVVCSDELPVKINSKNIPSISFVPSVAGILCTSYVINDILDGEV